MARQCGDGACRLSRLCGGWPARGARRVATATSAAGPIRERRIGLPPSAWPPAHTGLTHRVEVRVGHGWGEDEARPPATGMRVTMRVSRYNLRGPQDELVRSACAVRAVQVRMRVTGERTTCLNEVHVLLGEPPDAARQCQLSM
jgi:hypothetical protein